MGRIIWRGCQCNGYLQSYISVYVSCGGSCWPHIAYSTGFARENIAERSPISNGLRKQHHIQSFLPTSRSSYFVHLPTCRISKDLTNEVPVSIDHHTRHGSWHPISSSASSNPLVQPRCFAMTSPFFFHFSSGLLSYIPHIVRAHW